MYVRLAFAVAAHLDSEILIVDEVLAVGDAEFQKKCIGKMGDVSKGEGRTVLFVSHNMASIRSLCERGIVLEQGKLGIQGNINTAIEYYKQKALKTSNKPLLELKRMFHSDLEIDDIVINGERSQEINLDTASSMLNVRIKGTAKDKMNFNIEIRIYTSENTLVTFYSPGHMKGEVKAINKGEFILEDTVLIPKFMASGEYILQIQLSNPNIETYFSLEDIRLVKSDIQTVTGRTLSYNDIGFFLMERDERLSSSI
jgi:lipopolysaccharide transport system ATP-binding protein